MLINSRSYQFSSMYVKANGIKTHFYVAGEGEPLVLVHGGGVGTNALTWKDNIEELAKHYRVYALDRIGFGQTDKPAVTYTYEVLVKHLADFIDALCLDKVHLIGHSMGAYGVAKYTVDHPERVKKLVLVASGSTANAMGLVHDAEGLQALNRAVFEPSYENLRDLLDKVYHQKHDLEEQVADIVKFAALEENMKVMRSIHEFREQLVIDPNLRQRNSLRYRLPELTIPMILLWGKHDRFAPFELGLKLKDMLPNLRAFHVFEHSGHAIQHDEPELFNKTVLNFLAEQ